MSTARRATKKVAGVNLLTGSPGAWLDLGDATLDGMIAAIQNVSFTGGTSPDVDVAIEMSEDKSTLHVVDATFAAGVTAAAFKAYTGAHFRFIRFTWTVGGGPSVATGDFVVEA